MVTDTACAVVVMFAEFLPIAPVPLTKFTVPAVMVPLVRVIVPDPFTDRVAVVPAVKFPLMTILLLDPLAVCTVKAVLAVMTPVPIPLLPVVTVSAPPLALIVPLDVILPPVVVTVSEPSLDKFPPVDMDNAGLSCVVVMLTTPPEPPDLDVNCSVPLIMTFCVVLLPVSATETGVDEVKFEKSTVTPAGTSSAVMLFSKGRLVGERITLPPVATPLPFTINVPPTLWFA